MNRVLLLPLVKVRDLDRLSRRFRGFGTRELFNLALMNLHDSLLEPEGLGFGQNGRFGAAPLNYERFRNK